MTFSDWDYINGSQNLDGSTYVSAPSSLRQCATDAGQKLYATCKLGATTALVNARIVEWVRFDYVGGYYPSSSASIFRFQDTSNLYMVEFSPSEGKWRLNKIENGITKHIATQSLTFTPVANTWYKLRATFWESGGYVYARLERWDEPNWVQQGSDLSDTSPSWPGGGKVGVCMMVSQIVRTVWHDDTEIWG